MIEYPFPEAPMPFDPQPLQPQDGGLPWYPPLPRQGLEDPDWGKEPYGQDPYMPNPYA